MPLARIPTSHTSGADARDTLTASMPQFLFSASVSVDFVTTSGHALTMASFTSPEAFSLPAMSSGSAPAASGCWAACGERCEGEG